MAGLEVVLVFSVIFGSVTMKGSSSPANEMVMAESKSGSNNVTCCSSYGLKKFITQSYFEKYENFVESNFQEFLADETFRSCKLLPDDMKLPLRLLVAQRHLIGEGSHRHLSSNIRFNFQPESLSELPTHFCKVIIIERLPFGVFADPFELQHLLQRGAFTDIAAFGDTNLELPSFLSNRSVVEIRMNVDPNIFSGHVNGVEISVDLPLHARYPSLSEDGYTHVEFAAPDLFMHCNVEGNPDNESCLFKPINAILDPHIGAVIWRMPSGIKAHSGIVSVVTFVAAFMSALLIVLTSIFYPDDKLFRNSKQS